MDGLVQCGLWDCTIGGEALAVAFELAVAVAVAVAVAFEVAVAVQVPVERAVAAVPGADKVRRLSERNAV